MKSIIYVGIDVHSKSFTLCCYTIEVEEILYVQKTKADYKMILKYLERIRSLTDKEVEFICGYESGCLGYTLYHQLTEHNVKCIIIAPSTMPVTRGKKKIKVRQTGNRAQVIAYVDCANERLRRKYYIMVLGGKKVDVAKTAIARELACFIWGMMTEKIV